MSLALHRRKPSTGAVNKVASTMAQLSDQRVEKGKPFPEKQTMSPEEVADGEALRKMAPERGL